MSTDPLYRPPPLLGSRFLSNRRGPATTEHVSDEVLERMAKSPNSGPASVRRAVAVELIQWRKAVKMALDYATKEDQP